MIAVDALCKSYGAQPVLQGVGFTVPTGCIAAVIGKNGCGKSTLLAILASVLKPDAGRVLLGGMDPFTRPQIRRRIGYVTQGDSLFEDLSVRDNLLFWAAAWGIGRRDALRSPFVSLFGLESFLGKRVRDLSGGMRRRAAICTALIADPAYLLLDEPFTGLDLIYKQELAVCLRQLGELGKTLLYTTHSGEELADVSDLTLLLGQGRILLAQRTQELLRSSDNIRNVLISLLRGEH